MTLKEIYVARGIDGVLEALEPIYAELSTPKEPAPILPVAAAEEADEEKE